MHHYAGVRVVTLGGQPRTGPMQGASGSRGARVYDTTALDSNIDLVQRLLAGKPDDSADVHFLPNRTEALDVYIVEATVNLRDQVRPGGSTPLQFLYDAADCRIYFTPQTATNMSALWLYAADAIWSNTSLCVEGSTGYAVTAANSNSGNESISSAPVNNASAFDLNDFLASIGNTTDVPQGSLDGPLDAVRPRFGGYELPSCTNIGELCPHARVTSRCLEWKECSATKGYCIPTCNNLDDTCVRFTVGTCFPVELGVMQSREDQGICWPRRLKGCRAT